MTTQHADTLTYRRVMLAIVTLLLATGLTALTVFHQRSADPLCFGRLSAGFPLAVVCDASGESPLSSVGLIDAADIDSVQPVGLLADIVFYGLVLWSVGEVSNRVGRWGSARRL